MSLYSKIIDLQKLDQAWEKARKNNPETTWKNDGKTTGEIREIIVDREEPV